MRLAWSLLIAHVLALGFGLGGLLIALPRPELWSSNPTGVWVFAFGMQQGGALHIVLGAAAAFVFGVRWLGWRKTLVFFALATLISLGMELLGTSTGWPFGGYSYTVGLGPKVFGLVPFTIPLSWFLMGFSAYLLAMALAERSGWRPRPVWSLVLGVWLLTAWDLVLDPAMAHASLPVRFWVWHESGPYFGMPVRNFAGWALTGLLFMALSRLIWRADRPLPATALRLPFTIYLANTLFATALSLNIGLWQPAVAALVFGLTPALLAVWRPGPPLRRPVVVGESQ